MELYWRKLRICSQHSWHRTCQTMLEESNLRMTCVSRSSWTCLLVYKEHIRKNSFLLTCSSSALWLTFQKIKCFQSSGLHGICNFLERNWECPSYPIRDDWDDGFHCSNTCFLGSKWKRECGTGSVEEKRVVEHVWWLRLIPFSLSHITHFPHSYCSNQLICNSILPQWVQQLITTRHSISHPETPVTNLFPLHPRAGLQHDHLLRHTVPLLPPPSKGLTGPRSMLVTAQKAFWDFLHDFKWHLWFLNETRTNV